MANILSPRTIAANVHESVTNWANSVFNTLSKGVTYGAGTSLNSNGVYNAFEQSNTNSVLFRIEPYGTVGATLVWPSPATGAVVINHGLKRLPIGFRVCDADGAVTVYRSGTPTVNTISLIASVNTVSVVVEIF
jgi:hypothetical protein